MHISSVDIYCLSSYFNSFFGKRGVDFCKSLSAVTLGMMRECSCSTGAISTAISAISGKSFSAADKQIRYLFSNIKFQVDDQLWRCYLKMIFAFLVEGGYIKTSSKIYIQIDYTSLDNDFLILSASIVFRAKAVPIFFTMRRYPKRKNMTNLIKMEKAFIKGLNHCLSSKYQYVIVADRGFGNQRFVALCEENNFQYILRLKGDLNINFKDKNKLKDIKCSKTLTDIHIPSWSRNVDIICRKKKDKIWYLCHNLSGIERKKITLEYERRFKIEKLLQDQKSDGFNIEKTKIRKYDKLKRMLFCICLSQSLILFTGDILKHNHHKIKKTFAESVALILAFSSLERDT